MAAVVNPACRMIRQRQLISPRWLNHAVPRARTYASLPTAAVIKQNCRKVMCIGRNYADHITELNNQKPKQPFFFLKPPSSILLPGDGSVQNPKGVVMHYEIELGLVIGKKLTDLDPEDTQGAIDAIDSYVLAIDMTGRNVQDEAKRKGLPWSIAKGFDTFLPISEIIPKSKIPDPHNAEIWLTVNGETKQSDSTGLMIFRIPQQLSKISRVMGLEPGDIVLTGTPKGVGPVKSGDRMQGGIKVDGKEIPEGSIDVLVEDKPGPYEFAET